MVAEAGGIADSGQENQAKLLKWSQICSVDRLIQWLNGQVEPVIRGRTSLSTRRQEVGKYGTPGNGQKAVKGGIVEAVARTGQ